MASSLTDLSLSATSTRNVERITNRSPARVSKYYADCEKDILNSIESELMGSNIDLDRKETIQEAFKALEYGLYRLPVRALLPDMERTMLEDWLGTPKGAAKTLSQKQIHRALENLAYADVVPNVLYDHRLFGKFAKVLYEFVSLPSAFEGEDIPNRHAALHGWVNYGTKGFCFNNPCALRIHSSSDTGI